MDNVQRYILAIEKERNDLRRQLAECREQNEAALKKWRTTSNLKKAAERERDRLRSALERIERWSKSYPLTVFPKPDYEKAHALLQVGGMTLDSLSASAIRHVVKGIGDIARQALGGAGGE